MGGAVSLFAVGPAGGTAKGWLNRRNAHDSGPDVGVQQQPAGDPAVRRRMAPGSVLILAQRPGKGVAKPKKRGIMIVNNS
jgi:hypothetical protein